MKSVNAIQEVKVLPRVKVSHQPGSRTRWPEETKVRSRGRQVVGVCIEPRKLFESGGPNGDKRRSGCFILLKLTADSFILLERSNRTASWRAVAEATGVVDQLTTIQG